MYLRSWTLLAILLGACTSRPEQVTPRRKSTAEPFQHVVLIVIDTLRADITTAADTPVLDRLAASGGAVPRAWASGTWTVPSIVSLFTGASVRTHGWDLPAARLGRYPVLPDQPTLPQRLRAAGFSTTGLYANPYLAESLGFARGFDRWNRVPDAAMPKRLRALVEAGLGEGQRHFLYLHLMGPHSPLRPSDEARERAGVAKSWFDGTRGLSIGAAKRDRPDGARAAYRDAYAAVVEDTDNRVGSLLENLGPLRDDALVIVTSDHGELLGEHDIVGHGSHLWEPLTHVPLIVGDVIGLPATMTIAAIPDLVTQLVGVSAEWPTPAAPGVPLVAQRDGQIAFSPNGEDKVMWIDRVPRAFDLKSDPGELVPVPLPPEVAQAHITWSQAHPPGAQSTLTVKLPGDVREALRTLGYAD